eukprot:3856193-Amphidinium_carterae.1
MAKAKAKAAKVDTPQPKRNKRGADSAVEVAHHADASTVKVPRRRADVTAETATVQAIRDNLKPPEWTQYRIYVKVVEGTK